MTDGVVQPEFETWFEREPALFDALFDHLPMGIAIYDLDLRIRRCNTIWQRFWLRVTPGAPEMRPGMRPHDVVPEKEAHFRGVVERVRNGETVRHISRSYQTAEGTIWLDFVHAPLREGGQVTGCIEVIHDVTDQVNAETALRERVAFDDLVTGISTRFVNLPAAEVDAGIEAALGALGEFAGVDRSYVFLFNDELTTMSYTHEWCAPGIEPVQYRLQDFPLAEVAWSTGHMLRREVLHVPRVDDIPEEGASDRAELQAQGVRSLLLVPMVYLERPVGFLGFDAVRDEKVWPDESIRLLTIVGEIFVNALQRKRSDEALRERELQYHGIFETTSDGLVVIDPESGLIVDANPAYAAMYGYRLDELPGLHWTAVAPADGWSLREDALKQAHAAGEFHVEAVGRRKDGSSFPVDARGAAFTYKGRAAVLGVVRDITEQVAARDLLEQRVEERTRELATLLEVSHDVASVLDLDRLFELIFDQLRRLLPDYGGSAIVMREGEDAVVVASRTEARPEAAAAEIGLRYPGRTRSALWEPMERREAVAIDDVRGDSPMAEAFREVVGERIDSLLSHVRAWVSAPLIVKDQAIGILTVSSPVPGYFTPRRVALVTAIASQAAVAIENARLLEQAQGKAALEERQRLARELHDSVSQALYGIALGARTARTLLERDPQRVGEPLEYVLSLAEAGLAEMRALIFELRPESLAQEGLVVALEKQAASVRARHRLEVVAHLAPEPPAPLAVKEALYRIAQESLNNTVKHARATRIELTLATGPAGLTLEIADNGAGFDPAGDFPGHLGLQSMQERATRAGGHLDIESAPGHGTMVRAVVPLER